MKEERTFYIDTSNVCTRLQLHANEVKSMFIQNGLVEVDSPEKADEVFVNTCAFLKKMEDKTIRRIIDLRNELGQEQKITVFGCLPQINPERVEKISNIGMVVARETDEVAHQLGLEKKEVEVGQTFERKLNWIGQTNRILNKLFFHDPYFEYLYEKDKAFHLKIGSGCLGNCSYCVEKMSRGGLKSRRIDDIFQQFQKGLDSGRKIFSFNSDDTGIYGLDNGENIAMLLEKVLSEPRDFSLVLTEFNPWGLVRNKEKILDLLQSPKIVFITIPIQSGSNDVLKRMRRPYRIEDVLPILNEIRKRNPKLRINTHLIVGFPGETEEDFKETFDLIKKFKFNKIKVFEYSDRPNVESYGFGDKVPEEEIKRRKEVLKRYFMLESLGDFNIKRFMLNLGPYY